jgi:hypothetical protein
MNAKDHCRVRGCTRDAETKWSLMDGKPEVPLCWYHFKRRLWWYKGQIFDLDE